jgi:hypothetical protein
MLRYPGPVVLLLPCLAVVAHAQSVFARTWYGPDVASFHVQFGGNPYDPDQNDVRVKFIDGKGKTVERLAYFDEEDGSWKAVLVAEQPGPYRPILIRNGKECVERAETELVQAKRRIERGFLRTNLDNPTRFAWDTGAAYYPLGFNLGWQGEKIPAMKDQIATMGENGVNWTRIWSNQWDGKNPWWPQNDPLTPTDQLWAPALKKWDDLQQACEKAGIAYQMVLFNHGSFSTKTDPNWGDHPWNAAKGGFLKDAADFFTDAEAKRRTKLWLRYAVARYAHSPSLMAWELFNEVEWTDAYRNGRQKDVADWHTEMATYIRSIDPYEHLITTSSITDDAPWMGYLQPHTYSETLVQTIQAMKPPASKPLFYGEFGPAKFDAAKERSVLRDGIYGSMLSNQSGVAAYWYWDRVHELRLYDEFRNAAKVIALSGRATRDKAHPVTVTLSKKEGNVLAIGEIDWLLARVTGVTGDMSLTIPSLAAGSYELRVIDLESGEDAASPLKWEGIGGKGRVTMPSSDAVIVISPKG